LSGSELGFLDNYTLTLSFSMLQFTISLVVPMLLKQHTLIDWFNFIDW